TGVVSGPLIAILYAFTASSVSFGSHSPAIVFAFSPARTSNHASRRLPPYDFATAASNTRTLARQMSGPVPSPSMNGTIGSSGTVRRPSRRVIAVPLVGGFKELKFGMDRWTTDSRLPTLDSLGQVPDRKSTRLNSSHGSRSYA